MANEQIFLDRSRQAFRDTPEYQAALKADAIERAQRQSAGRIAIKQALMAGDARHASRIQQQLQDENADALLGQGGRAAGLDAYQNGRSTDYIEQARQRGQQELSRIGGGSAVSYGPGYLREQQDPDFANAQPWLKVRNGSVRMPSTQKEDDAKFEAATSGAHATTPLDLKNAEGDAYRYHLAQIRREQSLVGSLPPELKTAYAKMSGVGGLTAEEKTDFLAMPPEQQYAKLRTMSMAGAPRSPNTGGEIQRGMETHDFLGNGQERQFGSVGSSDFPSIMKPVVTARPRSALAAPPAPAGRGFSDYLRPPF